MNNILLCLDTDPQPSVFDSVVAIDAGVNHLLRHGGVTADAVEPLVHGAMFTRAPGDLRHTAIFIGGSDVSAGAAVLAAVTECFFGPMRVSVLLDSNGCNTTAAAAVVAAARHVELDGAEAAVIGTGAVGQRAAQMLLSEGARVRLISRKRQRAEELAAEIGATQDASHLMPRGQDEAPLADLLRGADVLIAAGPAGVEVVDAQSLRAADSMRVAIDLNATPPLGVAGIESQDKAQDRNRVTCYGALGVGGTKMKTHRAAIKRLFESSDAVLDAVEVLEIGKQLELS